MTMVAAFSGNYNPPTSPSKINYNLSPKSGKLVKMRQTLPAQPNHRHMWIITGPAGCGKSTVAAYLAKELSIPYIEGDDYHTESNKAKMASGSPLTDADRWDWLISLRNAATSRLSPTNPSTTNTLPHDGVVVTCSALKRKYRDVIRIAAYEDHDVKVHFIFLRADARTLLERVGGRKGHYMKSAMVKSQIEVLEEPSLGECQRDVLEVDCGGSLTGVQKEVVQTVREVLADDQEDTQDSFP